MAITASNNSLITADEAQEVIKIQDGFVAKYRTPLLMAVGLVMVIVCILLVMIILSLRGSRTGLEAVFPFLDKDKVESLQLPAN